MNRKDLEVQVASISQKLAKVRGELDSLVSQEKDIKSRIVASRSTDGDVSSVSAEASHALRENQTRQDISREMIHEFELKLKDAQQALDDRLRAELAIPWDELEADIWKNVPGMQKVLAELNSQVVALYLRMEQTKAVTAESVPLKMRIPFSLQEVHNGLRKAWQSLETLNQMSPRRTSWPNDGSQSQVPGFGKVL
jgi:chromosome condensin MukBEF ATPase and DNA-binding subunit MukB